MSLPTRFEGSNRSFNNADSFAMAFDEAWSKLQQDDKEPQDKLKIVLSQLKDHPFLEENPKKASEVALFRIRLLGL